MPNGTSEHSLPRSLLLVIRFAPGDAVIVRCVASPHSPRPSGFDELSDNPWVLRRAELVPERLDEYPLHAREFHLGLHREDGTLVDAFAWWSEATVFGDKVDLEVSKLMGKQQPVPLQGGPFQVSRHHRLIHIARPEEAEFLALSESEIEDLPAPSSAREKESSSDTASTSDDQPAKARRRSRILRLNLRSIYPLVEPEGALITIPQQLESPLNEPSFIEVTSDALRLLPWNAGRLDFTPFRPLREIVLGDDRPLDVPRATKDLTEQQWPNISIPTSHRPEGPSEHRETPSSNVPSSQPDQYIESAEHLIKAGAPESSFNIAITGDGFQVDQMDLFRARANEVIHYLLNTPPFSTLRNLINVYRISAVSRDSGVSECDGEGQRSTYFKVTGRFNGGVREYCGTHSPEIIDEAVARVVPRELVPLVIVIVNCSRTGGSAFPELGLAFANLGYVVDASTFPEIAVHEAGHVLGKFAEEYISATEAPLGAPRHLNLVTRSHVNKGRVWWKSLAEPPELDRSGKFKAHHDYTDALTSEPYWDPVISAPANALMLGLYWGCQYIEETLGPGLTGPGAPYRDTRGRNFFRGRATCKMRKLHYPFCRVCTHVLTRRILASAGRI